jgi:hypothetical protein
LPESGFIPADDATQANLVFWNVANGRMPVETFADFLRDHPSDAYAFVEFSGQLARGTESDELKAYNVHVLPSGMCLITNRGTESELVKNLDTDRFRLCIVKCAGLRVAIVDILPNPFYDRGPSLETLQNELVDCDVVCGDFNTPYDSIHMSWLRNEFQSGRWNRLHKRETWPSYLPVLAIDHIFVAHQFRMTRYVPIKSWTTDHYALVANWKTSDE